MDHLLGMDSLLHYIMSIDANHSSRRPLMPHYCSLYSGTSNTGGKRVRIRRITNRPPQSRRAMRAACTAAAPAQGVKSGRFQSPSPSKSQCMHDVMTKSINNDKIHISGKFK